MTNKMRYSINAKNAELQGLRFSISFPQMRDELCGKCKTISFNIKVSNK